MTTIVNTPTPQSDSSSGLNGLMMVVAVIILVLVLLYFGLPVLRRSTSAPQINIPDQVDVNVNTPNQ